MNKLKNLSGARIREARLAEKPKATQSDLSARLAVQEVYLTASSIGKIENGARPVTDIQLAAFSKALRVSVAWLLNQE